MPIPAALVGLPTHAGLVFPAITAVHADGRPEFGRLNGAMVVRCLTGRLCQVCAQRLDDPVVLLARLGDPHRSVAPEPACTRSAPPTPAAPAP